MLRRNTIAYLALLDVADDENGLSLREAEMLSPTLRDTELLSERYSLMVFCPQ